jgi:heme/copper-type cytochrome/quinol oxidase subunit 3
MSTAMGTSSAAGTVALESGVTARAETTSTGKIGMWVFLATDAMGFAGLLMAYAVLRVRADQWPDPQDRLVVWQAAAMTGVLVTSSFTMTLAARAAREGRDGARTLWHALTLVLGTLFLSGQVLEYVNLAGGPHAMGLGADLFASTFYAVTGYHALHVVAGLVILLGVLVRRSSARSLEVAALFWHFVDLAWIPIFTFLYLLPTS